MSGTFFKLKTDKEKYYSCWVCDSKDLELIRKSGITGQVSSENFAITNFEYGVTGELWKCSRCGFIQCTDLEELVSFYEDLEDQEYEKGRNERLLQEKRVLLSLKKLKPARLSAVLLITRYLPWPTKWWTP